MNVERNPLTLNEPSRPPAASGETRTPGDSSASCGVLAAVERQRPSLLAGDDLAAIARVGLQQHGARADLDGLAHLPDCHRQLDALAGANRHLHVLDQRDGEARPSPRTTDRCRCAR